MENIKKLILAITCLFFLYSCTNNRKPWPAPLNIGGYVIGHEICNTDLNQDYWLLDFTAYPNQPHIGDTLVLNGIKYTNVLKVKGLSEKFRQIGMAVAFDYKKVTPNIVITTGCTISNPETYPLKELIIINQGEIR